jgi:antitoxin component YwqK of YwqJK toxin-antitoxin module
MNPQNPVDYDELDFDYSPNGVLCLWQGQPFTGVGIERYADGTLQAESIFRNGFDTQAGRLWYPTGQVQRDAVADDAHHTLLITKWHGNGTLKSQTTYEHGVKIAEQSWDTHGTQLSKFGITEHDEYYSILQRYRVGNSSAT